MTNEREPQRGGQNTSGGDQTKRSEGRKAPPAVPFSPRIAELAKWQGGHVTTEQLHDLGLSRRAIVGRAERGGLIRVYRGVYAVGHLPATPHDRAHGALLAAGERSALAGRTALALWRRDRDWPDEPELISARDIRVAGLAIRRSGSLIRRDIRTVQRLRVTSPARTALDLAALVGADAWTERGSQITIEELTRIVNDLRHVNRLKVAQLRDVVRRNPYHPGAKHLIEIIGESQRQPTRSELENAFKRMIRRHGLPMPLINVHVGGELVDGFYPDQLLIVELDGREVTHADDWRPAFEDDRRRVVDVLMKTGIPTIRFTHNQTTRRHNETAEKLARILEARAGLGAAAEAQAGLGEQAGPGEQARLRGAPTS